MKEYNVYRYFFIGTIPRLASMIVAIRHMVVNQFSIESMQWAILVLGLGGMVLPMVLDRYVKR